MTLAHELHAHIEKSTVFCIAGLKVESSDEGDCSRKMHIGIDAGVNLVSAAPPVSSIRASSGMS